MGPRRTCVGCRRVACAADLVRVVRDSQGGLRLGQGHPGRGAWLCADRVTKLPQLACLDQAARRRAFDRAFRAPVGGEAVAALRRTVRERARIETGATAGGAPGRD